MSTEIRYLERRDEHAEETYLYKAVSEGKRLKILFNLTTDRSVDCNTKMFKRAARKDTSFKKVVEPIGFDDGGFGWLVDKMADNHGMPMTSLRKRDHRRRQQE